MFSSKSSKPAVNQQQPSYGALRVQTSSYGVTIGAGFGTTRLAGNLVWSGDFESHAHTEASGGGGGAGKGGGGGGSASGGSTTYTYSTSFAMGLCQGPVMAVGAVWQAKERQTLAATGGVLLDGAPGQAPWGYLDTKHPDQALGYSGLAYIGFGDFDLGQSNSLPNLSFEVAMLGPPANALTSTASGHVGSLNFDIGNGVFDSALEAHVLSLIGQVQAIASGGEGIPIWDTHFSWAIKHLLTAPWGGAFPAAAIGDLADYSAYCQAMGYCLSVALQEARPANEVLDEWVRSTVAEFVWSDGQLRVVPYSVEPLAANGAVWSPDQTPVYDLGPDDFITNMMDGGGEGDRLGGSSAPVTIRRSNQADTYNRVAIEFIDRDNDYNVSVAEAEDTAYIEAFGLREASVAKCHWFASAEVAALAASMALARHLAVTTEYEFYLGWRHVLLEPMDLVTLTDPTTGLDRELVRVIEIEEDENGRLTVRAENVPEGISAPPARVAFQRGSGWAPDLNQDPGASLAPIIFDAPAALSSGPEVWLATAGGPNWGGAEVWLSYDGDSYSRIGRVTAGARMGQLVTGLPAGSAHDTDHTLSVDLGQSRGALSSGTAADAQAYNTLLYVGGELLAYQGAALTGPYAYDLTGLRRGAYGSTIADHAAGAAVVRLDGAVFRFTYPRERIGQTVFIKLASYNPFGGAVQGLDEVEAVSHTIAGPPSLPAPGTLALASDIGQALVTNDGLLVARIRVQWDDPTPATVADYVMVQYKQSRATTWETLPLVPLGVGYAWVSPVADGAAYDVRVRSVYGASTVSGWVVQSGYIVSCRSSVTIPAVTGLELYGLGNDTRFTGRDAKFDWRLSSVTGAGDFADDLTAADSGWRDDFFRSYVVRVYDLDTGRTLRTEYPTDPGYTYTYEKNVEDGGPRRAFRLGVATLDVYGRMSDQRFIAVSNPPPSPPSAIEVKAGFNALYLSFAPDPALDVAGSIVWASPVQGFEPTAATRVYQGSNTAVTISASERLYIRLATYDLFGVEGLALSAELTAEPNKIGHADLEAGVINESNLFASLGQRIDLVDADASVSGSVAQRVSVVQSQANDTAASLEEAFLSIDGLSAQYTIKLDLNGYVAGFGLAATESDGVPSSEFIVRADRFAVASPSGGGDPAVPFVVDGGLVSIDGAQIAEASIGSASIASLAADKLTAGTIAADDIFLGGGEFALSSTAKNITVSQAGVVRAKLGGLGGGHYGLNLYDAGGSLIFGSGGFAAAAIPFGAVADLGGLAKIGQITAANASTYIADAALDSAQISSLVAGKIQTGKIQNGAATSYLDLDAATAAKDWLNANDGVARIRGDGFASFSAGEIAGDFEVGGLLKSSMIQHCYGYGHVGATFDASLQNYTYASITGPWEGYTPLEMNLPGGSVWMLSDIKPYIMAKQLGAYISGFAYVICTLEAFVEGDTWKPILCWADSFALPQVYDGTLLARTPRYQSYLASSRGLHGPLIMGSTGQIRMRYQLSNNIPAELIDAQNMENRPWTALAANSGGFQPVDTITGSLQLYPVSGGYQTHKAYYGGGFRAILMRVANPVLPPSGWTWGNVIIG